VEFFFCFRPQIAKYIGRDIMKAQRTFTKPILPPLRAHEKYVSTVKLWAAKTQHRNPISAPASCFWHLQDHGITDNMLQVLEAMRALTLAINHYLQGKTGALTLGQLCRTRIAIERELLMLPSGKELILMAVVSPNLYECCRLAGMIFGVAVILSIPNTYHILQVYVTHLKIAVEKAGLQSLSSGNTDISRMLLWILMLGGIAALGKPERRWFVSQLSLLVDKLIVN
jgi:hypothetical protein